MQALVKGFKTKNKQSSTTDSKSKHRETINNSSSFSKVISIRLPNVTENLKSIDYMSSSSSTNNQIIVTEKQSVVIDRLHLKYLNSFILCTDYVL